MFDYKDFYNYLDRELFPANREVVRGFVRGSVARAVSNLPSLEWFMEDRAYMVPFPKEGLSWIYVNNPEFPDHPLLYRILLERHLREEVRLELCRRKQYPEMVFFADDTIGFILRGFVSRMIETNRRQIAMNNFGTI